LPFQDCFFLDVNILLDMLFDRAHELVGLQPGRGVRGEMIKKLVLGIDKNKLDCFASSSVYDRLSKIVEKVNASIADVARKLVSCLREQKKPTSPGSNELLPFSIKSDLFLIEKFFRDEFRQLSSEEEKEGLRRVEYMLVDYLEQQLRNHGETVRTEEVVSFIENLLVEINKWSDARNTAMLQVQQKVERKEIIVDSVLQQIFKEEFGWGDEDSSNTASALQYQDEQNVWVVFVSTDYKHIINWQEEIFSKLKLMCSDPIYAVHHLLCLREMAEPPRDLATRL